MKKRISELFSNRGSDKDSRHMFGFFYDWITDSISIESILEIGVLDGASAFAWRDFDPKIRFIGVDMDLCDGVDVIQTVTPDYSPVISRCINDDLKFDIVIDDGSHNETCQVESKRLLFEFVKPGGLYVIENAHSTDVRKRFPDAGIIDNSGVTGHVDSTIAWWRKR